MRSNDNSGIVRLSERPGFKILSATIALVFAVVPPTQVLAKGQRSRGEPEARRAAVVAEMRSRLGPDPRKVASVEEEIARLRRARPHRDAVAMAPLLESVAGRLRKGKATRNELAGIGQLLASSKRELDPVADRRLLERVAAAGLALEGTAVARAGVKGLDDAVKALGGPQPERKSEAPKRTVERPARLMPRERGSLGTLSPELRQLYAEVGPTGWLETEWGPLDASALARVPEAPCLAGDGRIAGIGPLNLERELVVGALSPPMAEDLAATAEAPRTEAIVELARSLGNDPLLLFNYVHDRISVEFYYGSKKGAVGVLAEGAGNDFDQAALLVALLRAAGVPARYEYATIALSPTQLVEATGFDDAHAAAEGLAQVGYPVAEVRDAAGALQRVKMERLFVRAFVPYGNYRGAGMRGGEAIWVRLDPALKRTSRARTANLRGLAQFDFEDYLGAVRAQSPREIHEANLLAAAKARDVCETLEKGLWQAVPIADRLRLLPAEHPGYIESSLLMFSEIPASLRFEVQLGIESQASRSYPLATLYGKRISVRFPGATEADEQRIAAAGGLIGVRPYTVDIVPSLRIDGTESARFAPVMPGTPLRLKVRVLGPRLSPIQIEHHLVAGGVYALGLSPGITTEAQVAQREAELTATAARGDDEDELDEARAQLVLAKYSRSIEQGARRLLALERYAMVKDVTEVLAGRTLRASWSLGLPVALSRGSYIIDVARESSTPVPTDGDFARWAALNKLVGFEGSALEHRVLEQVLTNEALSAVKVVQAARATGVPVLTVDATNLGAQLPLLSGYTTESLDEVRAAALSGRIVTIPQRLVTWGRYRNAEGYLVLDPRDGTGLYRLGALLNGGQSDSKGSAAGPGEQTPPCANCGAPTNSYVRFSDGDFSESVVDLSLPAIGIPIRFERMYRSTSMQLGSLGYGWRHNYETSVREETDGSLTYQSEDLRRLRFAKKTTNVWTAPAGWRIEATKNATGYRLTFGDGIVHGFTLAGKLSYQRDLNGNQVQLNYDASDRVTAIRDSSGRIALSLNYAASGLISSVTDAAQRTVGYHHEGQDLVSVADVLGEVERYAYGSDHQMVSRTDKRGGVWLELYDEDGRWVGNVDPAGSRREVLYDPLARKATAIDATGRSTSWEWNEVGNPVVVTDAAGEVKRFEWNSRMDKVSETDGRGGKTQYQYDANGYLSKVTDASGVVSTYTFSATHGRMTYMSSGGRSTVNTYDTRGNLLSSLDDQYNSTTHVWDSRGRLSTVTAPGSAVTSLEWYDDGNLLAVTDAENARTRFAYDAAGHLVEITDPLQGKRTLEVDARGQVLAVADALGQRTEYRYDAAGNRLEVRDAAGNTTRFVYDALGRLSSVRDAQGNFSRTEYDAAGRVTARVDARGLRTEYRYDRVGRLAETIGPDAATTSYGYCGDAGAASCAGGGCGAGGGGEACEIIDPRGNVTRVIRDASGRELARADALGGVWRKGYDSYGRLLSETNPNGSSISFNYYGSRLVGVTDPMGIPTSYAYDVRGNRTRVSTSNQATLFGYDRNNRLVTETNPLGSATSYGYDSAGNRTSKRDRNGRNTRYEYDSNGRLQGVVFEDGARYDYAHDSRGNRVIEKSPAIERLLEYDELNRLRRSSDGALGKELEIGYDAGGNRQSTTIDGTVLHYKYDKGNRLIEVEDADGDVIRLAYDLAGARRSLTFPNGIAANYEYDVAGRLIAIAYTKSGRVLERFSYQLDGAGNRMEKHAVVGGNEDYSYDAASRLSTTTYPDGRILEQWYDQRGNRINTRERTGSATSTTDMSYDGFDQIVTATRSGGLTTRFVHDLNGNLSTISQGNAETRYRYDLDDRLREVLRPEAQPQVSQWASAATASSHYVYAISYLPERATGAPDTAGCGSAATAWMPASGGTSPEWLEANFASPQPVQRVVIHETDRAPFVKKVELRDQAGELHPIWEGVDTTACGGWLTVSFPMTTYSVAGVRITTAANYSEAIDAVGISSTPSSEQTLARFDYDANGLRVKKVDSTGTTRYLLDGASVAAEYDEAGTRKAFYVNNPQRIDEVFSATIKVNGVDTKVYPLTDALGSIYALTDKSGTVISTFSYDVYGTRTQTSGTVALSFGFTGREHDPETGLIYMRDRYYDPKVGRFTQPDRLGVEGDGPNLYWYTKANPTNLTDPSGQFALTLAVRGIAGEIWAENFSNFFGKALCTDDPDIKSVYLAYAAMSVPFLALTMPGGGGYDSFSSFKRAMGPAGAGKQWHHIVPQYHPNLTKFGAKKVHNVQNLVAIPEEVHRRITGFYNSKRPFTNGKYVYEWVSKKPFQEQYEFGIEMLERAMRGSL